MDRNSSSGVVERLFEFAEARHILINPIGDHKFSPTISHYAIGIVTLLIARVLASLIATILRKPQLPTINFDKWDPWQSKAKANFRDNAKKLIQEGFEKYEGNPFMIMTDNGPQIMLSASYIDVVNSKADLSFIKFTEENNLAHLETFHNFRPVPDRLFEEATIKGLTRNLPKYTVTLSDEMASCLQSSWGGSREWHDVNLRTDVLDWVARLSSRIFVGPLLSDNKEWLRISIDYTVNNFLAVQDLKMYPTFLQPLMQWFTPLCRKVRADHAKSGKLLAPMLAARKEEIAAAEREGRKPDLPDDAIEWFRSAAKGRKYNDADIQLGLSLAAIHTTSDLLGQCILQLCKYPEILAPLREEATRVLTKFGWQKVALTELRLMDSFMKETQRVKPIGMAILNRTALRDVQLPGLLVRKGDKLAISAHRMWSAEAYPEPEKFDVDRFVKRREIPEYQNNSLFVATSKDHIGFSHGKHACPGRFFAANEVKIALLHLILKYDVSIADVKQTEWIQNGLSMTANPMAKISVRRREEELDLSKLRV